MQDIEDTIVDESRQIADDCFRAGNVGQGKENNLPVAKDRLT